ncbi:MAG: hypothetical protein DMG65_07110 [Candidatus Angelobacter sp. Gp1-AA117]|nr:MAG: hypothetical protein DMG65_07110 [Candidatus Angelobacter sp. Gp1-AA117]
MITFIVLAIALCAIALLYFVARSRGIHAAGQAERPVDLDAFRTLMDRDDEEFLRKKLSRSEFVHLKRRRVAVTVKYVGRIAKNSAIVLQKAENLRQDANAEVAQAAAQVIDMATQIRMQCMVAFAKLTAEYLFPSLQLTPATLEPTYQALREKVLRLGSLQPQNAAPLATAI